MGLDQKLNYRNANYRKYPRMLLEQCERELSESKMLADAMYIHRIQGENPYSGLDHTMALFKRVAREHAFQLIWC